MATFYRNDNNGAIVVYDRMAYLRELDRREARLAADRSLGTGREPEDMPPPRYGGIAVFRKELALPPREADRDELRRWAYEGDGRYAGTLEFLDSLMLNGGHRFTDPDIDLYVPFSNNNGEFWRWEIPYLMTPEMVEQMFAPDPAPELFTSSPARIIV